MSKAGDLIEPLRQRLSDITGETYRDPDVVSALNLAQLATVNLRPDSSQKREVVKLEPGTYQKLTPGLPVNRVLDVMRLMGADGETPGRALRRVERSMLDATAPAWHSEQGAPVEWVFDDRRPDVFYLHPGVTGDLYVDVVYSSVPKWVSSAGDPFTVDDIYLPALQEYALYQLWGGDNVESPNYQRAQACFQRFGDLLGVKFQSDVAASPKAGTHLR